MKLSRATALAGTALVLGMLPCAASAQTGVPTADAPAQADETIVVTGYRELNQSVGDAKRNADQIVDTLTQREIERMPDRSLAEVLDRLPGVSSDRGFSSSQARTVTVRGFDARYNSMDVDGNVIWNSSRNNRGTQARRLYWQGWSVTQIAGELGLKRATVESWKQRHRWDDAPSIAKCEDSLEARWMMLVPRCSCPECEAREPAFDPLILLGALVVIVAIPGRALVHVIAGALS